MLRFPTLSSDRLLCHLERTAHTLHNSTLVESGFGYDCMFAVRPRVPTLDRSAEGDVLSTAVILHRWRFQAPKVDERKVRTAEIGLRLCASRFSDKTADSENTDDFESASSKEYAEMTAIQWPCSEWQTCDRCGEFATVHAVPNNLRFRLNMKSGLFRIGRMQVRPESTLPVRNSGANGRICPSIYDQKKPAKISVVVEILRNLFDSSEQLFLVIATVGRSPISFRHGKHHITTTWVHLQSSLCGVTSGTFDGVNNLCEKFRHIRTSSASLR
jgi:hypothetical protein